MKVAYHGAGSGIGRRDGVAMAREARVWSCRM